MGSIKDRIRLNNGVMMPRLGYGVYKVANDIELMDEIIGYALDAGYESFDTAWKYGNEQAIGEALKNHGADRSKLFVTTKLWNAAHRRDDALRMFDESLKNLQMDYVDLYIIHWPIPAADKYIEAYKALEEIYKSGRAKAIGVSNFTIPQLKRVLDECEIVPAVNQVEWHPVCIQQELLDFCRANNIQLEAHSPFGLGRGLRAAAVAKLAEKYNVSAAQIILRWNYQNDVVVVSKSLNKERIFQNTQIFDFELTEEDMKSISDGNIMYRVGPHPDEYIEGGSF